jgi:CMP-N,N'-diacetyllegionaminic acid synthase
VSAKPAEPRVYLGVIPARGGSKRIPRKNLIRLDGVPLIKYTIEAARNARHLTAFLVSTDSDEIAQYARDCGAPIPEMRPSDMAGDQSPVVDTLRHALGAFERTSTLRFDAIVLLQPTSPFRRATDIDRAIELFERTGADTVTGVRATRDHPFWAWRKDAECITPFFGFAEMATDRKLLPDAYAENGAMYIMRRDLVLAGKLYGERVVPYMMGELQSADIDTPLDLDWAEFLLARRAALEGDAPT